MAGSGDTPSPAPETVALEAPERRDRKRPIKVFVTATERAELERRAAMSGMSLSGYLVAAGCNQPIRNAYDLQAVRDLIRVSGDLGRLGGLFKLWLAEKRGIGASVADVNRALQEARGLQEQIRELLGRV